MAEACIRYETGGQPYLLGTRHNSHVWYNRQTTWLLDSPGTQGQVATALILIFGTSSTNVYVRVTGIIEGAASMGSKYVDLFTILLAPDGTSLFFS